MATTYVEGRYIAVAAKLNRRTSSAGVASMVVASFDMTVSATSVRRSLHMNGLYTRVSQVFVSLTIHYRRARCGVGNMVVGLWAFKKTLCSRISRDLPCKRQECKGVERRRHTLISSRHIKEHSECIPKLKYHGVVRSFIGILHRPAHLDGVLWLLSSTGKKFQTPLWDC